MDRHDKQFTALQESIEQTLKLADEIARELRRRLNSRLIFDECAMRDIPWHQLLRWYRLHCRVEEVERLLSISSSMELISSVPEDLYVQIGYSSQ
jgi:hypothetical protein